MLLAFLSFVNGWANRFGRRGDNSLSGRNGCSLIVQQMRGSLAERFKCKRQRSAVVSPADDG